MATDGGTHDVSREEEMEEDREKGKEGRGDGAYNVLVTTGLLTAVVHPDCLCPGAVGGSEKST